MMRMPKVIDCMMADCAYNRDDCCHALAITVGGPEPMCDTFMQGAHKGGDENSTACVGACKVKGCRYNMSLECAAEGIRVMPSKAHPQCTTFSPIED